MQTIERLADLITHLPGNLIYYLMTLLLLEAAILFAWWQRRQLPGSNQLAVGLSIVLGLRLISTLFTAVDIPGLDDAAIVPVLEQLTSFATIIMLVWLALNWQDGQDETKDVRLLGISSVIIVVLLVLGLLFFVVFLALPQLRSAWYILQIVLLVGAMIWLAVRQRAGWGYLAVALLAFAVSAGIVAALLNATENAPYLMRYADLIAFPMLLVAFFRRLISGLPATEASQTQTVAVDAAKRDLTHRATRLETQLTHEKERVKQLQSQLQELSEVQTARLEPHTADLVALRSDLASAQSDKQQLTSDLEDAVVSLQTRTEEVARLRSELETTTKERNKLVLAMDQASNSDDLSSQIAAQAQQISQLIVAREDAESALVTLQSKLATVEQLSAERDAARSTTDRLTSDLELLSTERETLIAELKERPTLDQVTTGVAELKQKIQTLTNERDRARVELGKVISIKNDLSKEREVWLDRERELVAASDEAYLILDQLEGDREFVAKPHPDSIADGANTQQIMLATVQDLRKPLEAITAYAERLLMQAPYNNMGDAQKRYLENIRSGGERIGGMVDDLVRNTAAEQGPLQLDLTLADPTPTLENAISWAIRRFQDRDVALRVDIDPELPIVAFEQSALTQALHNLLNNAYLASPDHSEVLFSIHAKDATGAPALAVTVGDSGAGLAGDELDVVFTANHKKLANIAGLGEKQAGLRNVKAIVDAHNGHISVDSVPNRGANFHIVIPA